MGDCYLLRMATKTTVSVTRDIPASQDKIWAMVTDLPRMGEWSPENRGGQWESPATGPTLGATFKGRNERGKRSWGTKVIVNAFEPPTKFSFSLMVGRSNWCDWVYEITPTATGCTVIHSWVDHRSAFAGFLGKLVSGVSDRASHNKVNMEATLDNLARAAV